MKEVQENPGILKVKEAAKDYPKKELNAKENGSNGEVDLNLALKKYRLDVSKAEGLKPYMVFTDKELDGLLEMKPRNKEQLMKVKGFAEKKVAKYGDEILRIFNAKR